MANRPATSRRFIPRSARVRRWLSVIYLTILLSGVVACPMDCPGADTSPSTDLSVEFRVDPVANQNIRAGDTVTYRITVEKKGILNAGVEFEVRNVPPGVTATFTPARIAETARETQLVVQTAAGMRPGDHRLDLRGRLTFAGQGSPEWYAPVTGGPSLSITGGIPAFDLECAESTLTLPGGGDRDVVCRTFRDSGFTSNIDFSFSPKPGYLTISPDPASLGPAVDIVRFTIRRAPLVPTPASLDLVLSASSAGIGKQHTVRVEMPPDTPVVAFEIVCDGELTVLAGAARTLTCRIFRSTGFTDAINFSFAPHPEYLTIYNETASAGPGQASVEFSVVRALGVLTPAFFDLEVIARVFPFEKRARVRVHMPSS